MIYKCKKCYIDDMTGKVPMKPICKECEARKIHFGISKNISHKDREV